MRPPRARRGLAIAGGILGFLLAALAGLAVAEAPSRAAATAPPFPPPALIPRGAPTDAASAADIRDIRLSGAGDSRTRLLMAIVGAGLAALAGAAYLLWRRHRRRRPPLRSFELALQQLEAARGLLHAGRANDYCVAVSQVVRSYIETAFRIPVTQRTTEELVALIEGRADSPLQRHRTRLAEFLYQCDAAKFAGAAPKALSLESLHRSAADFVRETTAEAHDAVPAT